MQTRPGQRFLRLAVVLPLLLVTSCASALYLKTATARPEEVTGSYTLILYGARYGNDIENVALLAAEGTGFAFEMYAPEFDYTVRKHVAGDEALQEAEKFVSFHYAFWHSQLSRIVDLQGKTLGYEVRPLYRQIDFGYSDVLDIVYTLSDKKVIVRVDLIPELKERLLVFPRRLRER